MSIGVSIGMAIAHVDMAIGMTVSLSIGASISGHIDHPVLNGGHDAWSVGPCETLRLRH